MIQLLLFAVARNAQKYPAIRFWLAALIAEEIAGMPFKTLLCSIRHR